jgi:heme-degrading monooxygenase HmoA
MINLKSLDQYVPLHKQMEADVSPVVLVNIFEVAEEDVPTLLEAWEADANWLKQQPGYISTQLHQGIAGSTVFMNYAIWDSVEDFRNAFTHPNFQKTMAAYPDSAIASPHLFTKIAVPNICTE